MTDLREQLDQLWNSHPLTVAWFALGAWMTIVVAIVEAKP